MATESDLDHQIVTEQDDLAQIIRTEEREGVDGNEEGFQA